MTEVMIEFAVNGRPQCATVPARMSLADLLRDRLGLTGTHLGCEQGVCGACTVLVDDLPMRACLTLAAGCQDAQVVTIEGLAGADVDRLREAFATEGGLQCGFCTPGMVVSAWELIRRRAELTRDEICLAMAGNLCRCTGYNGIVAAITRANEAGIASETPTQEDDVLASASTPGEEQPDEIHQ